MNKIKNAVVLAAGLGSRLRPLTDEIPKCLTEVHGKPILAQTLDILERNGIDETLIVVGYLGQSIIDKFGSKYGRMHLKYIWNRIYDETNSMYSAWLARDFLEKGALLIEGDTVFEEALISRVLLTDETRSYWVLDKFGPQYDGSMSTTDEDGRIVDVRIVRGKLNEYRDNYFKSTGVLKIDSEYGKLFSAWLDNDVNAGNVQIYYDLVITKHIDDAAIYACDITGKEWMEIDSLQDLRRTEEIFTPTKYIIIVIDGAGDLPLHVLEDKTPLEHASVPNLDMLAMKGHTGLMRTMYPGLPLGSIVANLGILGYNPLRYYPNGRASFEALAQDIFLQEHEVALRSNLVSLSDGSLKDFTAGNISDDIARAVIQKIEYDRLAYQLYPGQSYRNLLIAKGVECHPSELKCSEPHMNIGGKIEDLIIRGEGSSSRELAERLNQFMLSSAEQIKKINEKLHTPADMLFLWSPSSEPKLPSFHKKHGIDGAVVSGLDFMRGIAIAARMENKKIQGATGYSDTDLQAKFKYAVNSLRYNDLVFIHVNAPDEESHNRDVIGKVKIIEKIDKELIGPMKNYLDNNYQDKYRLAVLPDHYTLVSDGKHSDHLVPYAVYGSGIKRDDVQSFCERSIGQKSRTIIKSYEFMDFFIRKNGA